MTNASALNGWSTVANSDRPLLGGVDGIPRLDRITVRISRWHSFDDVTSLLDWIPGFADAGNYLVSFTASP